MFSIWLHVTIPEDRRHHSDFWKVDSVESTRFRVETKSTLVGHREAKAQVGSVSSNHALGTMFEQELGPRLIDEDVRDAS